MMMSDQLSGQKNKVLSDFIYPAQCGPKRFRIISYLNSLCRYDDLISQYEIARYCKVSLILVEPRENIERNGEKRYIIDKDQCFIDAN